MEEKKELTEEIVTRDLVEEFAKFVLPKPIADQYKKGFQPFGSKSNAILMFFAAHVKLSNEDYHQYTRFGNKRDDSETYEYYKKRQKFQRFLEKKKPYFFDYTEYDLEAKTRKLIEREQKRLLKTQNK